MWSGYGAGAPGVLVLQLPVPTAPWVVCVAWVECVAWVASVAWVVCSHFTSFLIRKPLITGMSGVPEFTGMGCMSGMAGMAGTMGGFDDSSPS